MNRKWQKKLKFISICLFIVLFVEIIYVFYAIFLKHSESLYFDGMNALVSNGSHSVIVGSNNDNDYHYEKAKLSFYDSDWNSSFEKLYNVGYNSAFFGVVFDGKEIVAVGSYEKTKEDHNHSIRRALIVKYDDSGNVLFSKDFQLLDNSKFTSIVSVSDGYLVTGQSIYKNTTVGTQEGGALLIKYDKEGNIIWSRTYGSNKSAIYNDLLVYNDSIYVVGTDDHYVGILCKYDLNGEFITFNDYKYTDELGFGGITNIGDELFVCGANRYSKNNTYAMIVKYDLDCTYLDQVVYEDNDTARYNKIVVDSQNHLVTIGIKLSSKDKNSKLVDVFNYDGIIGKYDSNLRELAVVTYGDERDDYFTDIELLDGTYVVTGYSSYEDGSYLSKFIRFSDALKILGVN